MKSALLFTVVLVVTSSANINGDLAEDKARPPHQPAAAQATYTLAQSLDRTTPPTPGHNNRENP